MTQPWRSHDPSPVVTARFEPERSWRILLPEPATLAISQNLRAIQAMRVVPAPKRLEREVP